MFWLLAFAHLAADYPLQPNWMAAQKYRPGILALHAGVHFGVMAVVTGALRQGFWPHLLGLAAIHFAIDSGKNLANQRWPEWIVLPYTVDQLLHYVSIGLAAGWIERQGFGDGVDAPQSWLIYAIAYLLVTYVWFVTERVLATGDAAYRRQVIEQLWPRMIARAVFFSVFVVAWRGMLEALAAGTLAPGALAPLARVPAAIVLRLPYSSGKNGARALAIDLAVSLAGIIFVMALS